MENKLIPMVDFVLEQYKIYLKGYNELPIDALEKITQYANFLKQPLKLGMFLPCDENDVPLVEPINIYSDSPIKEESKMYQNLESVKQYQQAKDRVLFEGFEVIGQEEGFCQLELKNADFWITFLEGKIEVTNQFNQEYSIYTIEGLIEEDLTLTPNALKQFEL